MEKFLAVPPLVLAGVGLVSVSLPLLAWSLFARPSRLQRRTVQNLQRGLARPAGDAAAPTAESRRTGGLSAVGRRLTPGGSIRRLDRLLSRAGRPPAWPLDRLLAIKLVLPLVVA